MNRTKRQEDTHFWVLKHIQENPQITQRELAKALGVSLGGINYCLKGLMERGWVKLHNFNANTNKLQYAYLLTPHGVAEKAALTARYLKRKMAEYEALKAEIEALSDNLNEGLEKGADFQ